MSKSDMEAVERLRNWLKPGDTVYTSVVHVSRSGMQRSIKVYQIKDNQPLFLSYNVAKALGSGYDQHREAVKISGCGMDMGFHLVYELARTLWPNGYDCIGDKCPSNDHRNGDHSTTHSDGGYALSQRWL